MTELTLQRFMRHWTRTEEPKSNQTEAFRAIAANRGALTLEAPTGTGKTEVGITYLRTIAEHADGPVYYLVPNKTLVDQVKAMHPDVKVAYGRNEHECLYYEDESPLPRADEIPCLMLQDCPHRVDQDTGETLVAGVAPCGYYQGKYEAKTATVPVVATMAFFLYNNVFRGDYEPPAAMVIDEAHRVADVVRNILSYEITDNHLSDAVEALLLVDTNLATQVDGFRRKMVALIKKRCSAGRTLLEEDDIQVLLTILRDIDPTESMSAKVKQAIKDGIIDAKEKRETLVQLQRVLHDINLYIRSLEYALPGYAKGGFPLKYVVGFYVAKLQGKERVQYRLEIKSFYVAHTIKRLLSSNTLAYSATIGDGEIFSYETGIKNPFVSLGSDFPAHNTRIYMPTDTPDLAFAKRSKRDLPKTLRTIAKTCKRLSRKDIRSLVVLISNDERERFMRMCVEENVDALTYGNGMPAKEVAARFKAGEGHVLVGTATHYGEGVDLPDGTSPVIFFLRPAYPSPDDPRSVFERNRFGNGVWRLWNWRAVVQALQVRGRNVRSINDRGVTIFVSQQFRKFLRASLPAYLLQAYQGEKTLEACVRDTEKLLAA